MSLGNRIASRGQAAIRASLTSIPREPLLFLYPSWIRKSSTTSSDLPGIGSNTTPSHDFLFPPLENASTPPDLNSNLDSVQPANYEEFELPTSTASSIALNEYSPSNERSKNTSKSSTKQLAEINTQKALESPIEKRVRKLLSKATQSREDELARRSTRKAYQHYKAEQNRSWHADWRVVLADITQHTPQHGEWLNKAVVVKIPEESLSNLLHGLDDNFWEIGNAYDCVVELGGQDEESKSILTYTLSGSATSISKTTADILRVAPDVKITSLIKNPSLRKKGTLSLAKNDEMAGMLPRNGSVRKVVSMTKSRNQQTRADEIFKPAQWDRNSFYEYVRALTFSDVPNHLARFMYKKGEDHVQEAVKILNDLFANPDHKPFISRSACKEAMRYFVKSNQIEHARILYVRMEMMNMRADPEIFNIMLRGAAKADDIQTFHYIMHMMVKKGFAPNSQTWIAFIQALKDIRIRLYILAAMRDKGLLQRAQAMRETSTLLAIPEIQTSLNQSQSSEEFLSHMDSRYGSAWLSVDSGNQVLHVLGARGLISRAWQFLQVMESRFARPNNYSINSILHHCKQGSNLNGAIELLRSLPSNTNFTPDEETYKVLFETAWRARSYNVARVVWRYACLSAATSFRMRCRVFDSLRSEKEGYVFGSFAGEVIVGRQGESYHPAEFLAEGLRRELPLENLESGSSQDKHASTKVLNSKEIEGKGTAGDHIPETQQNEPAVHTPNPSTRIYDSSQPTHPNNSSVSRPLSKETSGLTQPPLQLSKKILTNRAKYLTERDLQIFKDWEPLVPLSKMLVEAFERDEEWRRIVRDEEGMELDLERLLKRAVAVPVGRKGRPDLKRAYGERGLKLLWT